jgi:hypothetical protein
MFNCEKWGEMKCHEQRDEAKLKERKSPGRKKKENNLRRECQATYSLAVLDDWPISYFFCQWCLFSMQRLLDRGKNDGHADRRGLLAGVEPSRSHRGKQVMVFNPLCRYLAQRFPWRGFCFPLIANFNNAIQLDRQLFP